MILVEDAGLIGGENYFAPWLIQAIKRPICSGVKVFASALLGIGGIQPSGSLS